MQFQGKMELVTLGEIMTVWQNKTTYFLSGVVQCGWDVPDAGRMMMVLLRRRFLLLWALITFEKGLVGSTAILNPCFIQNLSVATHSPVYFYRTVTENKALNPVIFLGPIWLSVLTNRQVKCTSHRYTHTLGGGGGGEKGESADHSGGAKKKNTGQLVDQTIPMLKCELGFSRIWFRKGWDE